jgi:hypothetical protein
LIASVDRESLAHPIYPASCRVDNGVRPVRRRLRWATVTSQRSRGSGPKQALYIAESGYAQEQFVFAWWHLIDIGILANVRFANTGRSQEVGF